MLGVELFFYLINGTHLKCTLFILIYQLLVSSLILVEDGWVSAINSQSLR